MKHNSNPKRGRGRQGGRRSNFGGNRTFDSNGPDVKVRGTAIQVCERYLVLARDASSAGDRIKAEGYLQHAEHYFRLVIGEDGHGQQPQGQNRFNGGRRPNMLTPAEVLLSGDQAPIYRMDPPVWVEDNASGSDSPDGPPSGEDVTEPSLGASDDAASEESEASPVPVA
jgi:hypothetical protein